MSSHLHSCVPILLRQAMLLYVLLLAGFICGCVHALHPYNEPSQQKLHLESSKPQDYSIRVGDGVDIAVPTDGRVVVYIPRLERGCATYLFGIVKVRDSSSYDIPAIQVRRGDRTVRKLSLNDLAKAPVDGNGYHILKIE